MSFRVATFNVHHCAGIDGVTDVARTASVIRGSGASLVALQELDRGMERSGGVDQPAELAEALGMEVIFFTSLRRGRGEYGNAVAAAPEVSEVRFVPLPRVGSEEPRGAITGRWGTVGLVVTHLSTHTRARRIQTAALAAIAQGMEGPVIVMGDLNQARRPGLNALTAAGFTAAAVPRTLTRSLRRRQIDHIFVSRGLRIERAWTVKTTASDHLPLIADIDVDRR